MTAVKISKISASAAMTLLSKHPEQNVIRLQLKQNAALASLEAEDLAEFEQHLVITDGNKGDFLLMQGVRRMEQYFVLDGILKRVVANNKGKEMILRFAAQGDMETSYAAWRLGKPTPYAIVCVTKVRVARLPLPEWAAFIEKRPKLAKAFELSVMRGMSEIMAHTITLHLLDAPGRFHRFLRKHPELRDVIPQKELASYLNLSAETLSRLIHRRKASGAGSAAAGASGKGEADSDA
jgi:CRP/FNR family transcriptional regulator, dissimilatory nitrate respiration regulator